MRIARLGWPLGRPSCGPKPGERSWPGPSLSSPSSPRSSSSIPPPLRRLLPPTPAERPSRFYFVCAVLSRLSSSLPAAPLALSPFLLRRAKMVHGHSRAPISPRILRGGSTSTPLSCAWPLPLVLPLYSPRFFAPAVASQSPPHRGFSSRYSFLYARDRIVRSFNAP